MDPSRADWDPRAVALAWLAGLGLYPALLALTWTAGTSLGLPPAVARARPAGALAWLLAGAVLPALEELAFRGPALSIPLERAPGRPRRVAAVLASAAAFACAHLDPWQRLGASFAGLLLAASRAWGASLGFAIALHAGLNACALLGWEGRAPAPLALGGALAWAAAIRRARRRR